MAKTTTCRTKKALNLLLGLLSLFFVEAELYGPAYDDRKPNVLVIMCDQLRYDTLGYMQDILDEYKGALRIKTPNLDKLAQSGVYFTDAYCMQPSCGPARTTLRTGTTIQRSGVQSNKLVKKAVYEKQDLFKEKVKRLEGYDQVLVENLGYTAEHYGKLHVPERLAMRRDGKGPAIRSDFYDFKTNQFKFINDVQFTPNYREAVKYLTSRDNVKAKFRDGFQKNSQTGFPYQPITLDSRYGKKTDTPLTKSAGFTSFERSEGSVMGKDTLPPAYTTTAVLGNTVMRALHRLADEGKPFVLTASFMSPHPPMICAKPYYQYYWQNRDQIWVPPSYNDKMVNMPYSNNKLLKAGFAYDDKSAIQEMTAMYYGLIEEVDAWVGRILNVLTQRGLADNTLVLFTSDHGEFLGAHSMRGKSILLEEAMRVPLIMSFPGRIAPNSSVSSPVSHLDVFATILDYVGASYLDKSDGSSLRSAIEGTRWNEFREEDYVVVETEKRVPMGNGNDLSKGLGDEPNFMIRKGRYQLMLPKNRNSQCMDMMFDLKNDKFQQNNLLGENAANLPLPLIEQAEYLKVLLLEWMQSNDGLYGYYSDPKYNADEGQGDMKEIEARRTWPEVEYWQSEDTTLVMKSPVWESGYYRQNAYLYIGRTAPGLLQVQSIRLNVGNDANAGLFQISPTSATIARGEYIRVKVSFRSFFAVSINDLKAKIEIYTNVGNRKVEIRGP